ncbi:Molybdopterin-guanine dinucleotide biosynthesis protein MobA [Indibacter alkaliphilus LW1]|uniref:Molybdopterin-guanine dinucleotide biosynthesis protein MobA n=2 Tax=Indibacter TaxID=647744 RepID=S2DHD2_INDAL|nr:Molybdopterin-guanine dinucleotide biosynthesis protein MobA [Indibacter alkaliphilus LW1]
MGEDKGLLEVNGEKMVKQVLEKLMSIGPQIKIITSNKAYKNQGFQLLPDVVPNKGPMGGLLTALIDSPNSNVFIIGCDMPLIPKEAYLHLIRSHQEDRITVASIGGIPNPLFSIYPKSLESNVASLIADEKLKMIDFIRDNKHEVIPMENLAGFDIEHFRNFNSREDLK